MEYGKYMIAGFLSLFKDDVKSLCSECGRAVMLRSGAEKIVESEGLKIICIECAIDKKLLGC